MISDRIEHMGKNCLCGVCTSNNKNLTTGSLVSEKRELKRTASQVKKENCLRRTSICTRPASSCRCLIVFVFFLRQSAQRISWMFPLPGRRQQRLIRLRRLRQRQWRRRWRRRSVRWVESHLHDIVYPTAMAPATTEMLLAGVRRSKNKRFMHPVENEIVFFILKRCKKLKAFVFKFTVNAISAFVPPAKIWLFSVRHVALVLTEFGSELMPVQILWFFSISLFAKAVGCFSSWCIAFLLHSQVFGDPSHLHQNVEHFDCTRNNVSSFVSALLNLQ